MAGSQSLSHKGRLIDDMDNWPSGEDKVLAGRRGGGGGLGAATLTVALCLLSLKGNSLLLRQLRPNE